MMQRRGVPRELKRFAAAFVGDPVAAKQALYGSNGHAPRFSADWCMLSGVDLLADLDVILCGGHSEGVPASRGIALLQPDGPLNIHATVSRHLYALSQDFCERLAALTDSRIQEIATDWYRLQYPFMAAERLPQQSAGRSQHRAKVLHSLTQLARVAIRQGQRLLLYTEIRRTDR
jgi:hypothetical protein